MREQGYTPLSGQLDSQSALAKSASLSLRDQLESVEEQTRTIRSFLQDIEVALGLGASVNGSGPVQSSEPPRMTAPGLAANITLELSDITERVARIAKAL